MYSLSNTPKISIIIPVYNAAEYLRECIDSVVSQSYENLEIICIDDGSTDNSISIIEEYVKADDRVKLIKQKNLGAAYARNAGVQIASGEYISYIDADDFISQGLYEEFIRVLNSLNRDIDIFIFNAAYFDSVAKKNISNCFVDLSCWNNHSSELSIHTFRDCRNIFTKNVAVWNKIYRKTFLTENNINFPDGMKYEDVYYYTVTMIKANSIVIDDKLFYNYRDMSSVGSASNEKSKRVLDIFDAIKIAEDVIYKENLFEYFKYALFQFKCNMWFIHYQYCPLKLQKKYFEEMRKRLIEHEKNLEPRIWKQLVNHEIYELVLKTTPEEFDDIYNKVHNVMNKLFLYRK